MTTPKDVKCFFSDSQAHGKAASSNGGWVFHQLLGDCLGLVNGERWARLRKRMEQEGFDRQTAYERLPSAVKFAREYVQELPSMYASSRSRGQLSISVARATARFPLFYMARTIYGPLNEQQEEELWTIGQQHAALMRYVVRGGIYRFSASWFLVPQMRRELITLREAWRRFNERMYAIRCSEKKSFPAMIEPLWEHALQSAATEAEVSTELSSRLMKAGFSDL